VLRSTTAKQTQFLMKDNPGAIGVVIDIEQLAERSANDIRELRLDENPDGPPLIGLSAVQLSAQDQKILAWAGLNVLMLPGMPDEFLIYQLMVQEQLRESRMSHKFGEQRKGLAMEIRHQIHEISQPLTALQGRLDVQEVRTPDGDPMKSLYTELVDLVVQVTDKFVELQNFIRRSL